MRGTSITSKQKHGKSIRCI